MTSFPKYSLGSSTEARQTAVAVLRHRVRLGHQVAHVAVSYPAVRVWGRGGRQWESEDEGRGGEKARYYHSARSRRWEKDANVNVIDPKALAICIQCDRERESHGQERERERERRGQ